jgi:hypothetical protein
MRADLRSTGNAMTNRGVTTSGSPQPVNRATPRGTPVKRHRHTAVMMFAAAIMALPSAITVGFLTMPNADPSTNENTASVRDGYRMGTITRETESAKCAHATFDNVTGQISRSKVLCDTTATVDEQQRPLGTIHTLKAISNSFR